MRAEAATWLPQRNLVRRVPGKIDCCVAFFVQDNENTGKQTNRNGGIASQPREGVHRKQLRRWTLVVCVDGDGFAKMRIWGQK